MELHDVQVYTLDVEDDVLEPDALRRELRVLCVLAEVLHCHQRRTMRAFKVHIGISSSVPRSVPKRGPTSILRQPTPTKLPKKNGLKS
jgi:hypothetical protein